MPYTIKEYYEEYIDRQRRAQETEHERRTRNRYKLIDIVEALRDEGYLPRRFMTRDVNRVLSELNIVQDNGEPFSKGWAGAVLSRYIRTPHELGARTFHLVIDSSSTPRRFKYRIVYSHWSTIPGLCL